MVDFMEHNVLVWGGSLMHGEAFAVGNALDACAFPYVGLLLCKQNQVQVRVCERLWVRYVPCSELWNRSEFEGAGSYMSLGGGLGTWGLMGWLLGRI